jgi:hypothetical protein
LRLRAETLEAALTAQQEAHARVEARLREALDSIRWRPVMCGGCGRDYSYCAACHLGTRGGHLDCAHPDEPRPCKPDCAIAAALAPQEAQEAK